MKKPAGQSPTGQVRAYTLQTLSMIKVQEGIKKDIIGFNFVTDRIDKINLEAG